ncbi:hypothetical protein PVL29_002945 [Vitis rotundifolia]|uniref:Pre-rRNA-processing protein ESF2 n=1 Tax=Vitis rotundifolia TaxID=103349 RepID=A0AA39E056_VITRO|nr:hypothetical protein PVL29_002945 [Vitis rotundifolia]
MAEEEQESKRTSHSEGGESEGNDENGRIRKNKLKKRLLKEASKADKRGVCYLSRIPPHMDHVKLLHRKRAGGFRGQVFSEGWVEFTKKTVAKRVANMLNGEQIGGRKRSSFYYDLWNIKYLSKFKWDDLTEEIEQKLALELSAAKRERDFYLSKVDKSRALSSIEERLKKKQKVQQDSGTNSEAPVNAQGQKVIRQFPQKPPLADKAAESMLRLSKDVLAGVFGGSS